MLRLGAQPRLHAGGQPRRRSAPTASGSCCSTTTASATRASSSAITAPLDPAAGVVMAAGVMRDWRDRVADRQRRDGARPHPARLRLPQRRAGLSRLDGAVADPIGPSARGGRLRPRDLPLGRRLRRAAVRLLGGRRPGPAAAPARAALRARPRGDRRPRALGDARLGLGAKELPDGLRARLRAAQVAGARRRARLRGRCSCARPCSARGRRSSTATSPACAGGVRGYRAAARARALPDRPRSRRGAAARSRPCAGARAAARGCAAPPATRLPSCGRSPSFTSPTPAGRRARSRPSSPGSAGEGSLDVVLPGPGQRRRGARRRRRA